MLVIYTIYIYIYDFTDYISVLHFIYIYIYMYNMCLYIGYPGVAVVKYSLADAGDTK